MGTALDLGERLTCMYTYETRMAGAASEAVLLVWANPVIVRTAPRSMDGSTGRPRDDKAI